ncbi:TadE/TadG family type IV pilus assembly protein [Litoreibacter halocynthiae]|uniref:TadE/TadG family type IV pilus assembly protein n=1 Tax=Litoreibacter halocynthiae TaxID=1242689 RepID=UPI002490682F|nr:TadE/TadG family type IV pilus assembly protein [Litoreibacter halocynthiae]
MTYRKPSRLVRTWRRLMGREDGNATIEFAILFPAFFLLFMVVFELGLLMTRYMMFDRALDISVREMRLSENRAFTKDQVKQLLCSQTVILANHCMDDLTIELVRLSDVSGASWTFPAEGAQCRDYGNDVIPVTQFDSPTKSNEVVFVRACMSIKPFFEVAGLGAFLTRNSTPDRLNMIAMSAFAVEPNNWVGSGS